MKKDLKILNKDSKLTLAKSKNLMNMADKILAKDNSRDLLEDDSWMQKLWDWGDENNIDSYSLPRDKKELLALTTLIIEENSSSVIPKEIGNLKNLIELDLWFNNLTELPKEIGNLKNLTRLNLGINALTQLPKEIGNLENLIELELDDNDLTQLPKEIGNLENLTTLTLYGNNLTELPEELSRLRNLTSLDLRNNYLTQLPEWIKSLSNLNTIAFSGENMTKFSEEIEKLNNISELCVSYNDLTELFKEIRKLRNLTELTFSGENLMELPKEIGNLVNLTKLNLSRNKLIKLPKEIGNLRNLIELNLNGNALTQLPKEIANLVNLTKLDLGDNDFTELPKEIGNFVNLTKLDLDRNHLVELPEVIVDLANLTNLNLYGTNLIELPKEIGKLVNLTRLNLNMNQLTALPNEIEKLSNLTELYLAGNDLIELPKVIVNLTNLVNLSLRENPNLTMTNNQKLWILKHIENINSSNYWIFMDDDLLDRAIDAKEIDHKIQKFANIVSDYRKDENLNPTPEIVERWINQFSEEYRETILSEMIHIFKKMYISQEDVNNFLLHLITNINLVGNDPKAFWKNISLLNIQEDGESQDIMVSTILELFRDELGIDVAVNDYSKNHFIYLDDILFSGKKLQTDLSAFMDNTPMHAKLDVFYIGYHTTGKYYVSEQWLDNHNSKNIDMEVWETLELENRKSCHNTADTLVPTESIINIEKVKNYLDKQPGEYLLRDPNDSTSPYCQGNNIFSSEENRQIIEREFTLAGLKINATIGDANKRQFWRPLGLTSFSGLGFGAMIVTYRNCPNNTPLALWWGSWEDDSSWTPLFLRKTYNRGSDG